MLRSPNLRSGAPEENAVLRSLLSLVLLVLILGTAVCVHGALHWPQAEILWLPALVGAALGWVCYQLRKAAVEVGEFQELSPAQQQERAPEIFAATQRTLLHTIATGERKLQSFWLSGEKRRRLQVEVMTARQQLAQVELSTEKYWEHVGRAGAQSGS